MTNSSNEISSSLRKPISERKILIVGCGGVGKSAVALALKAVEEKRALTEGLK